MGTRFLNWVLKIQPDDGNKDAMKGAHHYQLQNSADSLEPSQYMKKSLGEYKKKLVQPIGTRECFNLGAFPCYVIFFPPRGISRIKINSY